VVGVIVQRIDRDEWPRLLDYISFGGLDPVLERLLDAEPDETFEAKAAWAFTYPDAFSGARSSHLIGRRKVAEEALASTKRAAV